MIEINTWNNQNICKWNSLGSEVFNERPCDFIPEILEWLKRFNHFIHYENVIIERNEYEIHISSVAKLELNFDNASDELLFKLTWM